MGFASQAAGTLTRLVGQGVPSEEEERGRGPLSVIPNFFRDIGDIAKGTGSLITAFLGDPIRAATGGELQVPKIVSQLPGAFARDISERYGPLLRGNIPEFLGNVAEHPLFFGLDVTGAAALSQGALARALPKAAIKGVQDVRLAERLARAERAGVVDIEFGRQAEAIRAAARDAPAFSRSPVARFFFPGPRIRLRGHELVETPGAQNPVTRAVVDLAGQRFLTQPIEGRLRTLAAREEALRGAVGPGIREARRALQVERDVLLRAKSLGLTRIERPWVANIDLRRFTDRLFGIWRTRIPARIQREWASAPESLKRLPADKMERLLPVLRFVVRGDEAARLGVRGLSPVEAVAKVFGDLGFKPPSRLSLENPVERVAFEAFMDEDAAARLVPGSPEHQVYQRLVGRTAVERETRLPTVRMAREAAAPAWERLRQVEDLLEKVSDADAQRALVLDRDAWLAEIEDLMDNVPVRDAPLNEFEVAQRDWRLWVQARITNRLIRDGRSVHGIQARRYAPLRLALSEDGTWRKAPSAMEVRAQTRPTVGSPIYYPEQNLDRLYTSEFFEPARQKRSLVKARVQAAPPGGRMRFRGRVPEDLLNTDIADAYFRRLSEEIIFEETRELLGQVRKVSRPLTNFDEVLPGEKVIMVDHADRLLRTQALLRDEYLRLLSQGVEQTDAFAQALTSALSVNAAEAIDGVARVLGRADLSPGAIGMRAVPKAIAKRLEDHVREWIPRGDLRLAWDTATGAWRAFVLSGSPRWMLNNLIGNVIFLKLQGGRLSDVVRQLDRRYREAIDRIAGEAGQDLLTAGFFQREAGTVGRETMLRERLRGTAVGEGLERVSRAVPEPAKRLAQMLSPRRLNAALEDTFRRASFVTAAERAVTRRQAGVAMRSFTRSTKKLNELAEVGANPRLLNEALAEVDHFFNDYRLMSPLGRQVIRRFIMPFWSFYRHVLKLSLSGPFIAPNRFQVLRMMGQISQEMAQEVGMVPEWAEGALPIDRDVWTGVTTILSPHGGNPFDLLLDIESAPVRSMHPLAKSIIEFGLGRSTFTGREFSAAEVVQNPLTGQNFKVITDDAGNPINLVPVDKVRPNFLELLAQNFPQYQALRFGIAGGRPYDASTLLDIIRDPEGNVILDPDTGQPFTPSDFLDQLARLSGFTRFNVRPEERASLREEELKTAMTQYLNRQRARDLARSGLAGVLGMGGA